MTGSPAPPDWTLADVRARAATWAEHRVRRGLLSVATAGLVLVATARAAGGATGGTTAGTTLVNLLVGVVVGAALGLAVGHVAAAGTSYPRHVMRLPKLLASVTRPVGAGEAMVAGLAAVAIGGLVPPLGGLAIGASLVLLVPTGVGTALATALDRVADTIVSETGGTPRAHRSVASALLLTGIGVLFLSLLRVLWVNAPDCGLAWFGLACGDETAGLLTVGALPGAWLATPLGAAVAASLDTDAAVRPGTRRSRRDAGASDVALADDQIEELVDLVHDGFEQLSPTTRDQVVTLVASSLDGQGTIEDGDDVLERLGAAVRDAGHDTTVDAIATLHEHADTIGKLRTQYDRTPKLARGAIEKTATTAVRTAGAPRDVARPAVKTLLTMPEDDWTTLTATLDDVVTRFGAEVR